MILTCPECGAKYMVSQDTIGDKGRDVRCSKCSHVWRQQSERDSLDDLINRIQSEELDDIDFGDGAVIERQAAKEESRKKFAELIARIKEKLGRIRTLPSRLLASMKRKAVATVASVPAKIKKAPAAAVEVVADSSTPARSVPKGVFAAIILFVVCSAVVMAAHKPIGKIYPPSQPVFDYVFNAIGMGADAPEPMPEIQELLTFDHLEYGKGLHGEATLSGTLINLSSQKLKIPPVYVEIMSKENRILWGGFVDIGTHALDAEAQTDFKIKLRNSHIEGASILEVWFRAKTDAKGYNKKEKGAAPHSDHSSEEGAG